MQFIFIGEDDKGIRKMTLKDLKLKGSYNYNNDDLLNDFYIPVLSESILYKRIAGYFCSNSLAISAKGLYQFIENGGKIQLIANVIISGDDQEAIKKAIEEKEKGLINEIEDMDDALKKGHIRLLAWLIKNEKLDIKIAVVPGGGIEHRKKGILEDKEGNKISFSGSSNETAPGWIKNDEEFHVYCSWIEDERERHLIPDIMDFDELWENQTKDTRVYEVSKALKDKLLVIAPRSHKEFQKLSKDMAERMIYENKKRLSSKVKNEKLSKEDIWGYLREYQKQAINSWFKKDCKGIFQMATGTGKTFTALAALSKLIKGDRGIIVVIVAPKQLLVKQWMENLDRLGYGNIVPVMITKGRWFDAIKGGLLKIRLGREDIIFCVATYDSFSSKEFIELMSKSKEKKILIADEVHHAWAPKTRGGLLDSYSQRLGLSATPELYMDEEGTKRLLDYFGGICYMYGIEEAIPEFLTEYEYFGEVVYLTEEESKKYEDISKVIARMIAKNDGRIDRKTFMKILERSKILVNSESKWVAFEKILDDIPDIKKTLIYCSDKQIDKVKSILKRRKIFAHKITHEESLEYRSEIIDLFQDDKYHAIIAMKVLDEGIDVPCIKRAIILASSGNPVEYIQRRGRILRRAEGKDLSIIHDILVFPWKAIPINISKSEVSAIKREIRRVEEFASTSRNPLEVMNKVAPFKAAVEGLDES